MSDENIEKTFEEEHPAEKYYGIDDKAAKLFEKTLTPEKQEALLSKHTAIEKKAYLSLDSAILKELQAGRISEGKSIDDDALVNNFLEQYFLPLIEGTHGKGGKELVNQYRTMKFKDHEHRTSHLAEMVKTKLGFRDDQNPVYQLRQLLKEGKFNKAKLVLDQSAGQYVRQGKVLSALNKKLYSKAFGEASSHDVGEYILKMSQFSKYHAPEKDHLMHSIDHNEAYSVIEKLVNDNVLDQHIRDKYKVKLK